MKRLIFVALAFLVGCNGMGSAGSRFLPAEPGATGAAGAGAIAGPEHRKIARVHITMTVPRRHRRGRMAEKHPSTISPSTQSVGIAVNGQPAQFFNVTPSSPSCTAGSGGTTCTFTVNAPIGTDAFAVTTYNATGGSGTKLDYGVATVPVVTGKANSASIRLGPVVSQATDSGPGSLRYAIGNANPGDTIMFVDLAAGSTITLMSSLTISNSVTIAGPGVTSSPVRRGDALHAHATYSGISISGGGLQQLFLVNPGATMTISGLILTQGKATVSSLPGGAIYNQGVLTASADVFLSNTSTVYSSYGRRTHAKPARNQRAGAARPLALHAHCVGNDEYGGALYNHGTANVSGSTFDSNSVSSVWGCYYGLGGAVYNDEYGIFTSSGNTYVNNGAYYGGAVYNNSDYGSASFTGDTFNANLGCTAATGCADSGCSPPTHSCTTYPYGEGGAIYDGEGQGITVTNSTFTGNVVGGASNGSAGDGGALYLDTGTPNITGSTFSNNAAGGGTANCSGGYGGAVYSDSSGIAEFDNDTFTGNQAGGDEDGYGGAIYGDEAIAGTGDTFSSNTATGSGSPCYTDGYAYGGAVYADDGASFSNTTFTSNTSTSSEYSTAGALYEDDPARLTGDTFTSNQAIATGSTGTDPEALGGAIYNDDILTMTGNTFTSNSATSGPTNSYESYGGAIYNEYYLFSTGDAFTGNGVSISGATASEAYGGAVYSYYGGCCFTARFSVTNDQFKSNTATSTGTNTANVYGGAIYSASQLGVSGSTFSSNSATGPYDVYGGAIYTSYSGSFVTNSTFTGNAAATNGMSPSWIAGGAIYDDSGLNLSGGTYTGNSASAGGAIYEDGSGSVFSNLAVTGNSSSTVDEYNGGGGMYNESSDLMLVNSIFSANSATANNGFSGGGGIYDDDGMTMMGTTVSGNSLTGTATYSGGGGIYNYDNATYTNDTITGNSTTLSGGGFYELHNYTVPIINVTFYQNTASVGGGNFFNDPSETKLNVANSIFAGGSAPTGPDVDNNVTGTFTSGDYNIIQTAVAGGTVNGTTTHNQTANPMLLALTNNGGPTFTNADQASGVSPGTADIPFSGGLCNAQPNTGVDQRGFARGAGGRCDVGAYEFAGVAGSHPGVQRVRGIPGVRHPSRHRHARRPHVDQRAQPSKHHSH